MKKLLLGGVGVLALGGVALAQCGNCCGNCFVGVTTSTGCTVIETPGGTFTVSPNYIESSAAGWAVDLQFSSWWKSKEIENLSRDEVDDRAVKLKALENWAKGLSNHAFQEAYLAWVATANNQL